MVARQIQIIFIQCIIDNVGLALTLEIKRYDKGKYLGDATFSTTSLLFLSKR